MTDEINAAALAAACKTRAEYDAAGHHQTLSYDLARAAATDRGCSLCVNVDVIAGPQHIAAAFLQSLDDVRAEAGQPRQHPLAYAPRLVLTGGPFGTAFDSPTIITPTMYGNHANV